MIISNHLIGKMPIPEDAIIRINLAWIKDKEEARKIIEETEHDIYLDYPSGRTKPPRPTISFSEAMDLANIFQDKVKYFAVSNIEDEYQVIGIKSRLPKSTEFVPKIETIRGVENIKRIAEEVNMMMLDKEDLYVDAMGDTDLYLSLVDKVRNCGAKVLELQGVVFI